MGRENSCRTSAHIVLCPRQLAFALCIVSTSVILAALSLTHFNPKRFRIHPIPYLSDAGMRDPERIILSFGLALTGAIFLPIGICQYLHELSVCRELDRTQSASLRWRVTSIGPCSVPVHRLLCLTFWSTFATSFFIALFSAVPGLKLFHHVFALFFAASAATWCIATAMFDHACAQISRSYSFAKSWHRISAKYVLAMLQVFAWFSFGILWILLKVGWPYRLIPNKDGRFVILALLEYIATASLIAFIQMTANDLSSYSFNVTISTAEAAHDL